MKKRIFFVLLTLLAIAGLTGVAIAAFGDKGEILGSNFKIGSADIKFLSNLALGTDESNLTDQLSGPSFASIGSNWTQDYLIKIHNNTSVHLQLNSNAYYETINDPDDLRSIIYVEPINWGDSNNNGQLDEGELGSSFGRKTIIKWKTEGYDLSSLAPGNTKGMVLRFSTDSVSETKQGKSAIFDFIFSSMTLN